MFLHLRLNIIIAFLRTEIFQTGIIGESFQNGHKMAKLLSVLQGAGSRNVNKLLSKRRFGSTLVQITEICHYFSQNKADIVILKIDS